MMAKVYKKTIRRQLIGIERQPIKVMSELSSN